MKECNKCINIIDMENVQSDVVETISATNEVKDDKYYFSPGDLVTLKADIPNKPVMLVVKKETSIFKHDKSKLSDRRSILIGIRCRWFTTTGELQESIWCTKDIVKI